MNSAIASVVMMFGLSGSFGFSLGVPPLPESPVLSKIAPEECLFYLSSSGVVKPDPKSPNQTEQLLAEPEVQKFIAESENMMKTTLSKVLEQQRLPVEISADEIVEFGKMLRDSPLAFYISDVDLSNVESPVFRGAVAVKLGEGIEKVKAKLEEVIKILPPEMVQAREIDGEKMQSIQFGPNINIVWGFKKNYLLATMGEGEMEALLKRSKGKAPEWLTKIRQELPLPRISTIGYLNVKAFCEKFAPMGGPQAGVALEATGINNVKNIVSVAGLDETNYVTRMLVSLNGEPKGLLRFSTIKPLTTADLPRVPDSAAVALAAKVNPLSLFDGYLEMVEKIEPKAVEQMRAGVVAMEAQIGLKLREEILKSLGDRVSIYVTLAEAGLPEVIATVQVKEPQQATKCYTKLMELAQATAKMLEGNPRAPKLEQKEVSGNEVYTFNLQRTGTPLSPSWCLTKKELVIVLSYSPTGIEDYLSKSSGMKSLSQSPQVAKEFSGKSAPTILFYCNVQKVLERVYPLLPFAASAMQRQGINFDLSLLPSQETLKPHLTPVVTAVRRTAGGIEIDEQSPLPGLGITQQAPAAVALLLPAIQSARAAARRAASTNNMKQIMLAMHNYHDANKHFPPAYKADQNGQPLLSWRVLILPMMEYSALYEQFHLDEPWDSEHNKKLIDTMPTEYMSPNSPTAPMAKKTNYLTVRGENTIFPGAEGIPIAEITDGTSHTIAIVEVSDDKAVIWTKPDDFEYNEENPLQGLVGMHPGIFLAGFADGSVRFLPYSFPPEVLKGFFTRNGGEPAGAAFGGGNIRVYQQPPQPATPFEAPPPAVSPRNKKR